MPAVRFCASSMNFYECITLCRFVENFNLLALEFGI